jgi:hypothetical protein
VGGGLPSATETNVQWIAPVTAALSNMGVLLSAAIGTGNTIAFTFRDNASSQAVTCTASGTGAGGTVCKDLTHSFNVTKGDLLAIQITTTGIVAIAPTITIGFEYGGGGGGSGGGNTITLGAAASLPSSGQTAGNMYKATDEPLYFIFTSASAATPFFKDMPVTLPVVCPSGTPTGGWSWVNQQASGTCASSTNGPLIMSDSNSAGCCVQQLLVESAPSTPYSFTTEALTAVSINDPATNVETNPGYIIGMVFRESSTGKYSSCEMLGNSNVYQVRYEHNSSPTSNTTMKAAWFPFPFMHALGIKILDNGTNQSCFYSADGGANWVLFFTESRTAFMTTPNQVGWNQAVWFGSTGPAGPILTELFDFTQGVSE